MVFTDVFNVLLSNKIVKFNHLCLWFTNQYLIYIFGVVGRVYCDYLIDYLISLNGNIGWYEIRGATARIYQMLGPRRQRLNFFFFFLVSFPYTLCDIGKTLRVFYKFYKSSSYFASVQKLFFDRKQKDGEFLK